MMAADRLPVRAKLTAWYVIVLAATLLLFILGTSFILYLQLFHQLKRFAIEDIETVEGLLYFSASGALSLNEDYHNHPQSRNVLERLLEVITPDGKVLYRNRRLGANFLGAEPLANEGVGGYSERMTYLHSGARVLLASRRHNLQGRSIIIRLGYRETEIWSRIRDFLVAALMVLPVLLAVVALLGYQLAKRMLSPLDRMATRAEQITAEKLEQRLPVGNANDELGHLARVFNNVLDRLQRSFEQLRRFTSDASHELRTPLASIRSVGEVGLQKNKSIAEYQETVGSMLEEVTRLTKLVESLLTISRSDAGQFNVSLTNFSPCEVVREAVTVVEVLAEERRQRFSVECGSGIEANGDPLLFRQALLNILHNAVKYSPPASAIRITILAVGNHRVAITIEDGGPGIAPQHRDKIFDRFYRIDEARTREAGGLGLGLAIARWAVEAQGGAIRVESRDEGAAFTIELAAAQAYLGNAGIRNAESTYSKSLS